jgi:hypothetical protein
MENNYTYTQSRWSLDDLFAGFEDPNIEATYQKLEAMVSQFESTAKELRPDISAERFMEIVRVWSDGKTGHPPVRLCRAFVRANTQDQKAQIAVAAFSSSRRI